MSNKKKKKFVVKAQDKVRKDKGKVGLIISEKRDTVDHETFIGGDLRKFSPWIHCNRRLSLSRSLE